jgi:hypothetical protein
LVRSRRVGSPDLKHAKAVLDELGVSLKDKAPVSGNSRESRHRFILLEVLYWELEGLLVANRHLREYPWKNTLPHGRALINAEGSARSPPLERRAFLL